MKRRHILGGIALGAGALVVGWSILPPRQRLLTASPLPQVDQQSALNGWVRIGEDDRVTIVMSKAEMGQGVFTGLAMMLADELDARWDQIGFETATIDDIYNNQSVAADGLPFHPDDHGAIKRFAQWMTLKTMREFGLMATGGSSSMKDLWLPMRQAGASARARLVAAAAKQWQVPAAECMVKDGVVSHSSGKSARFGELAARIPTISRKIGSFLSFSCNKVLRKIINVHVKWIIRIMLLILILISFFFLKWFLLSFADGREKLFSRNERFVVKLVFSFFFILK
jgi:isoquinoline 1-oxidoreductase beta subunit